MRLKTETVQKLFAQKDEDNAKSSYEDALINFKESNKEFHPDNDEGGLKFSALERELSSFNTSGLKSKNEFLAVFDKAKILLGGENKSEVINQNPYDDTSSESGSSPKEVDNINLSSIELKLINSTFEGDKERYLKQKAKRPDYVDELLRWAK